MDIKPLMADFKEDEALENLMTFKEKRRTQYPLCEKRRG